MDGTHFRVEVDDALGRRHAWDDMTMMTEDQAMRLARRIIAECPQHAVVYVVDGRTGATRDTLSREDR